MKDRAFIEVSCFDTANQLETLERLRAKLVPEGRFLPGGRERLPMPGRDPSFDFGESCDK